MGVGIRGKHTEKAENPRKTLRFVNKRRRPYVQEKRQKDHAVPGVLNEDNRWLKLGALIPWDELENEYAKFFSENKGRPEKDARLIIRLCHNISPNSRKPA